MLGGMERFSAGRGSGTRPSAVGGGMAGGGAAPEPPSPAESDIRLILSECDRFTDLFLFSLERTIIRNNAFTLRLQHDFVEGGRSS